MLSGVSQALTYDDHHPPCLRKLNRCVKTGQINLFTVRHEPGRLCHTMSSHRGHVSALALDHDEKGFFSAGWDGDAIVRLPHAYSRCH